MFLSGNFFREHSVKHDGLTLASSTPAAMMFEGSASLSNIESSWNDENTTDMDSASSSSAAEMYQEELNTCDWIQVRKRSKARKLKQLDHAPMAVADRLVLHQPRRGLCRISSLTTITRWWLVLWMGLNWVTYPRTNLPE